MRSAAQILCLILLWPCMGFAAKDETRIVVTEPFIEMRTGPGRGFPIFHAVARDELLVPKKRRTSWVKVETLDRRPVRGWVHIDQLSDAESKSRDLLAQGANFARRFEWSVSGGDIKGASAVSTMLGFRMTRNLSLHANGTQILGDFSNGWLASGTIRHRPFPNWRLSPWFELGGGMLQTEPFSTIVQASDRKDNVLTVGSGFDFRLARRFTVFLDYHRHTVLTSRDENEEIDEWKIGIKVSL